MKFFIFLIKLSGFMTFFIRFRGFYSLSLFLVRIFNLNIIYEAEFRNNKFIFINLSDPYWVRILYKKFTYEPEVEFILEKLNKFGSFIFIDLGSNIGYWSKYASYLENCKSIYAFEPNPESFKILQVNMKVCDTPYSLFNAAISQNSQSNINLYLRSGYTYDANASIFNNQSFEKILDVENINFDNFFLQNKLNEFPLVIIKVDIEGKEMDIISSSLINIDNTVIIFEDHGSNIESNNVQAALDKGFEVYGSSTDKKFTQIKNKSDLVQIKINKNIGYNFVALSQNSKFILF